MEPNKKKHFRVIVKNIHETPANGIYLTNVEAAKFCVFGGIVFFILTIFAVFPRKK
ncbi:hypothetical protein CLNEO_05050 [Anaerotignum neopropionicum]|uniref:Uncharacterized protein n=1 Tax=Anaerotignum neopropionicum TaxID=36847 RepID=A0A136WII9_9FIRM|nr:hypothetical protein [Anaerotignum neopropionicum]KXL54274.1 hypothetical protein CLNEO_03760 [Anaerotignum neopropionicum]KXL54399.1 hypothetical protein CLNEO_05050 [Anaerotignum neopropionicum]